MEFPITKLQLQAFRQTELQRVQSDKRFHDVITHICKEIERYASFTPLRRYIYTVDYRYTGIQTPFYGLEQSVVEFEDIFPRILKRLHELFPDSYIELTDNTKHIIIDWT
jgi:hypothetical protein